jgi:D-glycero-D-manno-heptose 1,7-bisphosphate phosphatase
MRGVFIFDRDGTLIYDKGYMSDPDDVELLPGAKELVYSLKKKGFYICIATNQSGIGKGLYTKEDFFNVNKRVEELLEATFDAVQICPHRSDEGCRCRKPSPYMIDLIIEELNCSKQCSFMAGDRRTDVEAGKNAGLKTIWCNLPDAHIEDGDKYDAGDIADIEVTVLMDIMEYV